MTKRFHNAAVLTENTVAQHSWGVAWFAYLLSPERPAARVLLAAMAHDLAEQITGDMPAPAKRLLGIRGMLADKENEVLRRFGMDFENELNEAEERIVGLADCMDGMLYCVKERQLGNRFIEYTFQKFHSYIVDLCTSDLEKEILSTLVQLWEEASGRPFNESE